jgi:hypothetical protein
MGNLFSRAYNYIFTREKIIYSSNLQIVLPVSNNDIYKEYNTNLTMIKLNDNNINKNNIWII